MSTICFGKEEFEVVGNTILNLQLHGVFKLKLFEKKEIEILNQAFKLNEEDAIKQLTEWFMTKLSLANQLTYFYDYHEHKGSEIFDFHKFELNPLKGYSKHLNRTLHNKITLIEYNCYCSNGNNFLPGFIEKKLQRIKNFVADNEFRKEIEDESETCCVCGTQCIADIDCKGNWLCPDKKCSVHKED